MGRGCYKLVYCTPAIYSAGGVEHVTITKANYFAEQLGYDVTIIVTEGGRQKPFFPLSDKVHLVQLDIDFEELWLCPFVKKVWLYLQKQRRYKKLLTRELLRIRPDFTITTLRREINFINAVADGSMKIGELHVTRDSYRHFDDRTKNVFKKLFSRYWSHSIVRQLNGLRQLVVLTDEARSDWPELSHVMVIPNPLPFSVPVPSQLDRRRIVVIGRYDYEKGFDLMLRAWKQIETQCPDWELAFYGNGNRSAYALLSIGLDIEDERCQLNGPTDDVVGEYLNSSIMVLPSRTEGFGLAIIEAMACGLPVVAFDCPNGPRHIITDGVDGLLVANGDVEALASQLLLLTQQPERLKRMASQAVMKAARYDISTVGHSWQQLFERLKASDHAL